MRYIILALLFTLVILMAGFLALSQKKTPQEVSFLTPSPSLYQPTTHPTDITTQEVMDEAGLIRVDIPQDWSIMKEGAQGVRIAAIQAESSDFSMRTDESAEGPFTPQYYETGASLQISIQSGTRPQSDRPVGEIIEEKKVVIDGNSADYYHYKEPSTLQGEILDVRFSKDNKSYFFRFGFNPETLSNGEHVFFTIMDSVTLTD